MSFTFHHQFQCHQIHHQFLPTIDFVDQVFGRFGRLAENRGMYSKHDQYSLNTFKIWKWWWWLHYLDLHYELVNIAEAENATFFQVARGRYRPSISVTFLSSLSAWSYVSLWTYYNIFIPPGQSHDVLVADCPALGLKPLLKMYFVFCILYFHQSFQSSYKYILLLRPDASSTPKGRSDIEGRPVAARRKMLLTFIIIIYHWHLSTKDHN